MNLLSLIVGSLFLLFCCSELAFAAEQKYTNPDSAGLRENSLEAGAKSEPLETPAALQMESASQDSGVETRSESVNASSESELGGTDASPGTRIGTESTDVPAEEGSESQAEIEEFSKEQIPEKIKEASIYNKKGMSKESIALCQKILSLEPDNMQALAIRGCAYVAARQFQEGLNDLSRVLDTQKTGTHLVYGQRAMALLQLDDYDKAIADSNMALKLQPKNQQYFIVRALAYHRSNNFEKALKDFDDGIALDPEGPNLHLFLSLRSDTYMSLKRYGDAFKDLSKVIKLAPKDPQSWMNRAAFYIRTKDWEKAASDLDNVIDFAPMGKLSNQALILRAEARLKSGQYKASVDDYDSLLVGYPKESVFLAGRAEAQLALGNFTAALKDMDKLLKYNPYESKYFELRARVHDAMKNSAAAEADRKRAKELAADE